MALDHFVWPVPRAAYIHVPFCRHRCGYCNFSVIADRDDLIQRYLFAIDRELELLARPQIDTIFIGGGTPTHLDIAQLTRLLTIIERRFDLAEHTEWSVEANPEDITNEKVDLLATHGVNRISLGVQSFNNDKLRVLERGHDGFAVQQSIKTVASMIGNVSIDLIFAAPGETIESWGADLETALSLPIQHLSTYALTFEKGTSFWSRRAKGRLRQLDDELETEMYLLARSRAAAAGFSQYEISSFARDRFRCRHNIAYWRGDGWYGAGPGAARFVGGKRETNHRSTTTYLKRIEAGENTVAETEVITPMVLAKERVAFGLRVIDGVSLKAIQASTGFDIRRLCQTAINESIAEGFIDNHGDVIALTERGVLFADLVAARFLD